MYVYVSSLSALVGFGCTVTLSCREGLWSDVLVYKSADTFLIIADVLTGPYRYTTTLDFFDDGLNYDEETGNDV